MALSNLLSFNQLKSKGVVNNRAQLSRLIQNCDFPKGFLVSANTRRWVEDEVSDWLDARRAASLGEPVR